MSTSNFAQAQKRRRIQRACDPCRRKKVRCDGEVLPGSKCASCETIGIECTWDDKIKKRGPRKQQMHELEARLAYLESAIRQGTALPTTNSSNSSDTPRQASPFSPPNQSVSSPNSRTEDTDPEDDGLELLTQRTARLEVETGTWFKPIGLSSGRRMAGRVNQLKKDVRGPSTSVERNWGPEQWEEDVMQQLQTSLATTRYTFPDPDLLPLLVDAYMRKINNFYPLFHRSMFERLVADRVHERDPSFGAVLLMVCALGARYVADSRVMVPGGSEASAGWPYFLQVQIWNRNLLHQPRLSYLAWVSLGIAIKMLQEVGAHSRKIYSPTPNAHDELWKRVFWVTLWCEVHIASETGRQPTLHETDFDVELPVDCDDEYWDVHGDDAFRQPDGKPSKLSYFVRACQLTMIHMRAMRLLFAARQDPTAIDTSEGLAEIDSALNSWLESTPDHLRWDLHRTDDDADAVFFHQSAELRVDYNALLITVHRPFVAVRKPTPTSSASHAICTTAARANSRILAAQVQQPTASLLPHSIITSYNAAIILLLNLWGARRMNIRIDEESVMTDVNNCLAAMDACKRIYWNADELSHQIRELLAREDGPSQARNDSLKRAAEDAPPREPLAQTNSRSDLLLSTSVPVDQVNMPPIASSGRLPSDTTMHDLAPGPLSHSMAPNQISAYTSSSFPALSPNALSSFLHPQAVSGQYLGDQAMTPGFDTPAWDDELMALWTNGGTQFGSDMTSFNEASFGDWTFGGEGGGPSFRS